MRINRTCKICGDPFSAIKVTQFFCSRKCFKKDYYVRTKSKIQEAHQQPTFPIKGCAFCQMKSMLSFDPLDNPQMFNAWACPNCGCTNQLVWEHQNNSNSYQVISNILMSLQAASSQPVKIEVQYQTYQIPITRLENGNKDVLVLTCETLDIIDIQKRNRKKILFS